MITLKELINQFQNLFDTFQKDKGNLKDDSSFSVRTHYLDDTYQTKSGKMIRLEIGRRRHIADVLEIERKGYQGLTPWGYSALESDMVRSNRSLYLVFYDKLNPIAFLGARLEGSDIHITNIAVIPEWQDQGIGRLLIQLLIEVAKEEQVASLSLEVRVSNEKAQGLYRKMGFQALRVKKNYYHGDGEDALDMHLLIRDELQVMKHKEERQEEG